MISKADIKFVSGLQNKKQRQKYGQFTVEGEKSIAELLKSSYTVRRLFALPSWLEEHQQLKGNIQCTEVNEQQIRQISTHITPQRVLAVAEIPDFQEPDTSHRFILGLDEIQDPGNLGTIIRIADWYGLKQIFCNKGCTDVYAPKCISASMGSFLRVRVIYGDLETWSDKLGFPLLVSTLDGQNIHRSVLPEKGMLVIGNEGHGVGVKLQQKASVKLTIPRYGQAESLNAGVSAAVLLDNLIRN